MALKNEISSFEDLESNYKPLLPEDRKAKILDLGCGHGRVTRYLLSLGYQDVFPVDPDASLISEVVKFCPSAQCIGNTEEYLLSHKGTYDLIIAKDVIYYFPKSTVSHVMNSLKGALKVGGGLIVEVFNGATQTGPFVAYKDLGIEWVPTEPGLRHILNQAGFHKTMLYPFRTKINSTKRLGYFCLSQFWQCYLRVAHFLERGRDAENPTIWTKKIVGYASV